MRRLKIFALAFWIVLATFAGPQVAVAKADDISAPAASSAPDMLCCSGDCCDDAAVCHNCCLFAPNFDLTAGGLPPTPAIHTALPLVRAPGYMHMLDPPPPRMAPC